MKTRQMRLDAILRKDPHFFLDLFVRHKLFLVVLKI